MDFNSVQEWIDAGKPFNCIVCGDCMEGMRVMQDNFASLAICDPPYGINISQDLHQRGKACRKNGYREWKFKDWDSNTPPSNILMSLIGLV